MEHRAVPVLGWESLTTEGCKVIAEIGPADGSVDYALKAVDDAKAAGCWAVKGQLYAADRLVTSTAERYDHVGGTAQTQHEMFSGAMAYGEWAKVKEYADEVGILFFASVFDWQAVEWCEAWEVPLYKVASGDITNRALIETVASTGKPIIMSTGASNPEEIVAAVHWTGYTPQKLVLMACTLRYPAQDADANIGRVSTLGRVPGSIRDGRAAYLTGYSDHTSSREAAAVAAGAGAVVLEKHMTLKPYTGYDHDFALTPDEMAVYVHFANAGALLRGEDTVMSREHEADARRGARRSLAAAVDIPQGSLLAPLLFTALRPGTGLSPAELPRLVGGYRMARGVKAGTLLEWDDLEPRAGLV